MRYTIGGINFELRDEQPTDAMVVREMFEENVYRLNESMLPLGAIVLDLGANIGAFSLLAAKLQSDCTVYAYEPESANYKCLLRNIELNNAAQIKPYKFAVGAKAGVSNIIESGGGSYLDPDTDGEQVTLVTLDAIIKEHKLDQVDVLKIDVEGWENDIIIASKKLAQIKYIMIEFDNRHGIRLGALVEKLSETHHVEILGAASRGGDIYAHRYNM